MLEGFSSTMPRVAQLNYHSQDSPGCHRLWFLLVLPPPPPTHPLSHTIPSADNRLSFTVSHRHPPLPNSNHPNTHLHSSPLSYRRRHMPTLATCHSRVAGGLTRRLPASRATCAKEANVHTHHHPPPSLPQTPPLPLSPFETANFNLHLRSFFSPRLHSPFTTTLPSPPPLPSLLAVECVALTDERQPLPVTMSQLCRETPDMYRDSSIQT